MCVRSVRQLFADIIDDVEREGEILGGVSGGEPGVTWRALAGVAMDVDAAIDAAAHEFTGA